MADLYRAAMNTRDTWQQRVKEIREINARINDLREDAQLNQQLQMDMHRVARVGIPIVRTMLGKMGVFALAPYEHDDITTAVGLDTVLQNWHIEELKKKRMHWVLFP